MFGLFGKGSKLKKNARIKAQSWWKSQNILGMKQDTKECMFCRTPIPRMKGYLLTQGEVLNNDKYMNSEISRLEARGIQPEKAQEMVWEKIENTYDDWMVCEKCIERFI